MPARGYRLLRATKDFPRAGGSGVEPIADVLADPQHFSRVASCFKTGDRVSFTGFDSDAYSKVIEILPLALVDVSSGRARFYPQGKILSTKYERET